MLTFARADGAQRFDARVGERAETTDARWTLDGARLTITHAGATVLSARVVRLTAAILELEVDGAPEVPIYRRIKVKD